MERIFEKDDKELDFILDSFCEGIDFDIKNKKVSFNPNHENRINTGYLKDPKPIYSEFKNVYTGQKYKLISIFERKKDLSGLDGNPFIYALKEETGTSNKNDKKIWTFKSNSDILKIFRHFVYITKELNQNFDTLLVVPSSNKLNNIVMGYILRIIKQKNPNAILINDFLHKLNKGDVFNNIDFDSIDSEWIQNDIIDIFENKMDENFRYYLLPDEYRKYVTKTLYHENTLKYLPYFSDNRKILVFDDTISQGRTISETCKILIETCKVKPKNIVILTLLSSLKSKNIV